MHEFKVKEYISLKLENKKTFIYINGQRFRQCIRLMLQIPKMEIDDYDNINSIDEAAEHYKTLHENKVVEGGVYSITSEQEFWGHCSNLQVWAENDYDTRLLHSNLAFPLLKKLSEVGDNLAKRVLKEEIAMRFEEGGINVKTYLFMDGYLDYLDIDIIARFKKELKEEVIMKYEEGDVIMKTKLYECIKSLHKDSFDIDALKLKELIFQIINVVSIESMREALLTTGWGDYLIDITRDEVIEKCLKPKERETILRIIDRIEKKDVPEYYKRIKYNWIIDINSSKSSERWMEYPHERFFQILKGHVLNLELDLFIKDSDIVLELQNFKKLKNLYLYLHDGFFPNFNGITLESVEELNIRLFSTTQIDLGLIIEKFPKIKTIRIVDIINWIPILYKKINCNDNLKEIKNFKKLVIIKKQKSKGS